VQLGKAVFPNDQAAAPAAPLGSRNNPFTNAKNFKKVVSSIKKKDRAGKTFFFKSGNTIYKYPYDAQGNPPATGVKLQESLKQKREKLLNEAIFKKLVK
jgi:hypothetical protein